MQRLTEFAAFPVIAGVLGAATAGLATAMDVAPPVSVAIGLAVFAAAIAFRNWSVAETDRPLLADELNGMHDRVDAMQDDAADLRELLTDLAAIVEEAAAREMASRRSVAARLTRLEDAAGGETIDSATLRRVHEAIEPIADRLDHFEARTRKLALAVEKGLAAAATAPSAERPAQDRAQQRVQERAQQRVQERVQEQEPTQKPTRLEPSQEPPQEQMSARPVFDESGGEIGRKYALMLQAVFSVPDGEPRFFEAYTRRLRGDGAPAPSADHIPEAKASGEVGAIDNLQLVRCVAAAEQLRQGGREVAVFCNLSMVALRDPAYLRALLSFLRKNARLSRHLVFEFSQLELEDFNDPDIAVLQRLQETGFVFSIDHLDDWSIDIANLAKIGFRYVKLDAGALLAREEKNPGAVQRLARSFERVGLSLIVEKVETVKEAERLEAAGARFLQGAGLAEPRLIRVEDQDFANLETAARRAVSSGRPIDEPATGSANGEAALAGAAAPMLGAAGLEFGGGGWPGATAHRRPD